MRMVRVSKMGTTKILLTICSQYQKSQSREKDERLTRRTPASGHQGLCRGYGGRTCPSQEKRDEGEGVK